MFVRNREEMFKYEAQERCQLPRLKRRGLKPQGFKPGLTSLSPKGTTLVRK